MKKIIWALSLVSTIAVAQNNKADEYVRVYSPYAIEQQKIAEAKAIAAQDKIETTQIEAEVADVKEFEKNADNKNQLKSESIKTKKITADVKVNEPKNVEKKDERVTQQIETKKIEGNLSVAKDIDRYQNIFDTFRPNYKERKTENSDDKKTDEIAAPAFSEAN